MSAAVCIVTGANAGIGSAAALQLAQRGASVVMACRNAQRGEAARLEIQKETGIGVVANAVRVPAVQVDLDRLPELPAWRLDENQQVVSSPKHARDAQVAAELWSVSAGLVGLGQDA